MPRYVTDEKVPVTEGPDTIYIRGKMDAGQREQAEDALRGIEATVTAGASVQVNVGAYRIALLRINVLGWEGPGFEGLPFSPANILKLDPDDPLFDKVMEEIARRNPLGGRKADPLPGSEPDGSRPSSAISQMVSELESGIPTSYSPNGIVGPTSSPPAVTPTS